MSCTLTNHLAECRAAKGINKSQLAMRLKKSRAYVTRLERGDIKPSFEVALFLARYFGRPVEQIFHLVEEGGKR
jgi:putative transcriptional regulator